MATKKRSFHRLVRWVVQIIFLALFVFLFAQTRYAIPPGLQNIFFRFDPLIAIVASIAFRTVITSGLLSIVIIIMTLLCGRIFCGFICPLGTVIDVSGIVTKGKASNTNTRSIRSVKYLVFLFLVVAAILGTSFLHFFDPLVIIERTLSLVVYPIYTYFTSIFILIDRVFYTETIIVFIMISVIIGLNLIAPRLWCRAICPLGGFLAILSKFSLLKFQIHSDCKKCGLCEKICPTDAIQQEQLTIDSGECIGCFRCFYECPHNTILFKTTIKTTPFSIKRRHFLLAAGAGVVIVPLSRSLLHQRLRGRLIRPPGSIPESDFLNVCVHCGICMKACPTNGLQPCILEAGINGMWTPRLIPRIGGCEKNCNLCGQVCPTSAIRKLSLEEKTFAKMGTAVIDRSRCIAWEQDKVCLICDEACPFNAISSLNETIRETTLLRPFVDERICTGCGLCEARCPIEGPAAIQVFSIGEERKRTGSYVTEEKIKLRACEEKPEDIPSGFFLDE